MRRRSDTTQPVPDALPRVDALGRRLQVGDCARIPVMPAWLLRDLPSDERASLLALQGLPLSILEFDAFGYAWFGDGAPWFCLRPSEVLRDERSDASP